MCGVTYIVGLSFLSLVIIGFGSELGFCFVSGFTDSKILRFLCGWICPYKVLSVLRFITRLLLIFCDIVFQFSSCLFYHLSIAFQSTLDLLSPINPVFYKCISAVITFFSWLMIKLFEGLLMQSDGFTVFCSWLTLVCLLLSYLDAKYLSRNHEEVERSPNRNIPESTNIRGDDFLRYLYNQEPGQSFTNIRNRHRVVERNSQHWPDQYGRIQELVSSQVSRHYLNRNHSGSTVNEMNSREISSTSSEDDSSDIDERNFQHWPDQYGRIQESASSQVSRHYLNRNHSGSTVNEMNSRDISSTSSEDDSSDIDENFLFGDASREDLRDESSTSTTLSQSLFECAICMKEKRNVAVFPCGHTNSCKICVQKIMSSSKRCPLCTEVIQEYKVIYL